MSLFARPVVWLTVVVSYAALTFVLSLIAGATILQQVRWRIDLILHVVEYGVLAWLILHYLRISGRLVRWRLYAWWTLLICGTVGGLNELLQTQIPGRFGDFNDVIANLVGAALVIWWFRRRLRPALQERVKN